MVLLTMLWTYSFERLSLSTLSTFRTISSYNILFARYTLRKMRLTSNTLFFFASYRSSNALIFSRYYTTLSYNCLKFLWYSSVICRSIASFTQLLFCFSSCLFVLYTISISLIIFCTYTHEFFFKLAIGWELVICIAITLWLALYYVSVS